MGSVPQAMEPSDAHHMRLRHQCGICGVVFIPDDTCRGLIGNADSTQISHITDSFLFIDYGTTAHDVSGRFLCRDPSCMYCDDAPEAVTVHHDCFSMFRHQYVAASAGGKGLMTEAMVKYLDSLWRFAAWRMPWKHAPPLLLTEDYLPPLKNHAFDFVTAKYGISQLSEIPAEILQMINNRSKGAFLWRIIAAIDLANRIIDRAPTASLIVLVSDVVSWHRGGPLVLSKKEDATTTLPIIRLAIDSHGLVSVERVAGNEHRECSAGNVKNMRFVIKHCSSLAGVVAVFQDGLMRLQSQDRQPDLQSWDTPTPPLSFSQGGIAQDMFYSVGAAKANSQFCTINLHLVTGLTFFMLDGGLYSIHGHTEEAPVAHVPASSTPYRERNALCSIYVPLTAKSRVTALEARWSNNGGSQILLKTEFGGITNIGPLLSGNFHSTGPVDRPSLLIYTREETQTSDVIGAYSEAGLLGHPITETSRDQAPPPFSSWIVPFSGKDRYFSSATLDEVETATVFIQSQQYRACTGIIFQYKNGSRRAVGQCRPGSQAYELYTNPAYMCVSHITPPDTQVGAKYQCRVIFSKPEACTRHRKAWCCYETRACLLYFWFSDDSNMLQVVRTGQHT